MLTSGFHLFVLRLPDEKVSVMVISCSLLQEDAECCSLSLYVSKQTRI